MADSQPDQADVKTRQLDLAIQKGWLAEDDAQRLREQASLEGTPILEAARRAGLLQAQQCAILDCLSRPREVAPGFELIDVLGQGGMGVVYRARQDRLDRIVAIKLLATSSLGDVEALARFEREASAIGRLRHPHIVTAFDFGKHQSHVYLVMEYIDGTDLEHWIRERGRIPRETAWKLIRQAASGLSHAARQGVIHRDIKPANLLLVDPPEGFEQGNGVPMVKIADFGLAILDEGGTAKTRLTMANASLGTPHYMAPEQLDGEVVDLQADIYALGATAYHMLCGIPPYADLSLPRMIATKLGPSSPPSMAELAATDDASYQLIAAMMATPREKRIRTYDELTQRIDHLLAQTPAPNTTTSGVTASMETQVLTREVTSSLPDHEKAPALQKFALVRRRLLWIGAAAAVLLLTGGALAWFLTPPRLERREPPIDLLASSTAKWHSLEPEGTKWRTEGDEKKLIVDDAQVSCILGDESQASFNYFDLKFRLQLVDAHSVEIYFEMTPESKAWLQVTAEEVQLRRSTGSNDGPFPSLVLDPKVTEMEIQIICNRHGWWCYVDKIPAGRCALSKDSAYPIVLIKAVGGTAYLRKMLAWELVRSSNDWTPMHSERNLTQPSEVPE
jgi:serine/threonine protein kinase